jgi:high-affinity iron transporter
MFANFVIGLREGLEAALVVGILIAYVKKIGQGSRSSVIWWGVSSAIALCASLAAVFTITSFKLEGNAEPFVSGLLSFTAAGLITWMVIWLAQKARFLKSELEGALDKALAAGTSSLFAVAFFSVGREGLETAIFIWNGALTSKESSNVVVGTILGLAVASVLGWLLYLGTLKVNIAKFFKVTGWILVVVAAGMFSYGIAEFQEIGILPGDSAKLYDVSSTINEDGFIGALLTGLLNFSANPTVGQSLGWLVFLGITTYFFTSHKKKTLVNK